MQESEEEQIEKWRRNAIGPQAEAYSGCLLRSLRVCTRIKLGCN